MGVTLLLSTGSPGPWPTVPSSMIYNATNALLNPALARNNQESWEGQPLATGVARLLWLIAAQRPSDAVGPIKAPGPVPKLCFMGGNPPQWGLCPQDKKLPPGWLYFDALTMENEAAANFQHTLLDQFTSGTIKNDQVRPGGMINGDPVYYNVIEAQLAAIDGGASNCSTFRVRGASEDTVSLRLKCSSQVVDVTLTVEKAPPHRITSIFGGPTSEEY